MAGNPANGAPPPPAQAIGEHLAVLTDGGQDPGLAALINSLFRNGFEGTLWVGWRDGGACLFDRVPATVHRRMQIRLLELETERPLSSFKPEFLERVWELAGTSASSVSYLDCDIVLGCRWELIRAWLEGGLAIAEDLPQRTVGAAHPLRRAWRAFMEADGLPPVRELTGYFNSGFVGIPAEARPILPVWRRLVELIERTPGLAPAGPRHYLRGVRLSGVAPDVAESTLAMMRAFLLEDQDALNMALMATSVPLAPMGPDAMGFTEAMHPIVVHALGQEKPWNARYLRRLIRHGAGPSLADDMWWLYSDRPIVADPSLTRGAQRASYVIAKVLRRYA